MARLSRLPVILGRMIWRTVRRLVTREELWNREPGELRRGLSQPRFDHPLGAPDATAGGAGSIPALLARPEYAHLQVVHLRSPREARRWLESLPSCRRERAGQGGHPTASGQP